MHFQFLSICLQIDVTEYGNPRYWLLSHRHKAHFIILSSLVIFDPHLSRGEGNGPKTLG